MTDEYAESVSELTDWVQHTLASLDIHRPAALILEPLDGDAGFRRYFRLNTDTCLLAVSSPPDTEKNEQFYKISGWLQEHGVRAPKIAAFEAARGFFLLEDLGTQLLLPSLNEASVCGYYAEAMTMLLHLQAADARSGLFPRYSADLLRQELNLFDEWFCAAFLGVTLSDHEANVLERAKHKLVNRAIEQAQVVVHRDFHSRNLMVLNDGSLATIDFQDAVIGPVTYDLVSLLKDCYVRWSAEQLDMWVSAYANLAFDAGLIPAGKDLVSFQKDFDWMGLQRHLKVLGIFTRLHLRDGKSSYLDDVPRVWSYVCETLRAYDDFEDLAEFFHARLKPVFDKKCVLMGIPVLEASMCV